MARRIPKFDQVNRTFSVCSKLIKIVWKSEKFLFLLSLGAVLIPAIVPFIDAYIFKLIIDSVAESLTTSVVNYNYLFTLIGFIFVVSYIQRLSFTIQDYTTKIFYIKLPITFNQIILNKISTLDMERFEDPSFRDTLEKVRDGFSWRPQELMYMILFLCQSTLQVLIALYAIVQLNAFLALLIIVVAIPDIVNQILFSRFSWNIWAQDTPQRKKYGYVSYNLLQDRDSIKEIKIFGLRDRLLQEVKDIRVKFFNENKGILTKELKVNTVFNLLDTMVIVGIVVYLILQAVARKISIGDISFYQAVVMNFNNGIGGLFRNLARIFDQTQYMESIFDVLEIESKVKQSENPVKVDFNKTPKIEFKSVSFKYPQSDSWIFKDFSLVIDPGDKIALVGENGVGKTTLIKLLLRFYDVTGGEILINGTNLRDLDLETWYKTIGVLFQDFIRYEYSARDNIFFGKIWEKENLDLMIEAAKSGGAHIMIKKFDKEYSQMLGRTFEGGIELSGGQWQKIALARAFFRNAPVLVLDEPTAAIDAKAESEIFNKVENLSKDKTVIIISHRFSTVRNADKIYVIENGQIIESGSHKQLLAKEGQYASLFKLQAKGYQ